MCSGISLCFCLQAILNLDNTVVDLETLQALYENVSDTSFALDFSIKDYIYYNAMISISHILFIM